MQNKKNRKKRRENLNKRNCFLIFSISYQTREYDFQETEKRSFFFENISDLIVATFKQNKCTNMAS